MFNISSGLGAYAAVAALVLGVAGGAQAATVTVLDHSTQGIGNMAASFAPDYAANTPAGASWSVDPTVLNPPLTVAKDYKSPFLNTVLENTQTYFAADAKLASNGNGASVPVTLSFTSAQTKFQMLWGSVDKYNTVQFFSGLTSVFTYTGEELATMLGLTPPSPNLPKNYEEAVLLKFTGFDGGSFDSVKFSSGQPAFEFALPSPSPVPVPAAGLLLLSAVGGIAVLRRRKAAA